MTRITLPILPKAALTQGYVVEFHTNWPRSLQRKHVIFLRSSLQTFPGITEEIVSLIAVDRFTKPQQGHSQLSSTIHRGFPSLETEYSILLQPLALALGCENWSLTLRIEHRLGVFENQVPRRITGAKKDEIIERRRKQDSEKLGRSHLSPKRFNMTSTGNAGCYKKELYNFEILFGVFRGHVQCFELS
jgi:hypothetical protein